MKKMIINKNVVIQFVISILVFIIISAKLPNKWYEYILCFTYIECVIISFNGKKFNVYQLFLFMMFFFNLSIPFCKVLGLYEYPTGNTFMINTGIIQIITESTMVMTYKVLIVLLFGTSIGWLLNKDYEIIDKRKMNINTFQSDKKNLSNIFILLLPFEIIYQIILLKYSIEEGYVETIHLHTSLEKISIILRLIDYIYPFVGFIYIYLSYNETEYKKHCYIFLIPYLFQLFTGTRGNAISLFLTCLYIYSNKYKEIRLVRLITVFLFTFILIIGIGKYRFSRDITAFLFFLDKDYLNSFVSDFCSFGNSIAVLCYTIQNMNRFTNKIPFLLGYPFAIFSFSSNYTVDGILDKSYLAQHITYVLNPNKLLHGSTIGTSIAAEFYEFSRGNIIIIFILSILLLYLANEFIKRLYNNPLIFYFGMSYIQNLFLSPRGSVMKIFSKLSLVYVIIYFIYRFLLSKKLKG